MRTLLIDPAYCQTDGDEFYPFPLPGEHWLSFAGMAQRAHKRMTGKTGTILLTAAAAHMLQLTPKPDDMTGNPPDIIGRDGAFLKCRNWGPWMRFTTPRYDQVLIVGVLPWMGTDTNDHPLYCMFEEDTAKLVDQWHHVTGSPWFGRPAGAGGILMRDTIRTKDERGRLIEPRWTLDLSPLGDLADQWQDAETPIKWNNPDKPEHPAPYRHIYDVRRAWLAAAHVGIFAPAQLKHTGPTEYAARTAGMFLVRPYPWCNPYGLPDPAGEEGSHPRWMSHARLGLLEQLRREGVHPGYDIEDSWTAPGTELLRPWVAKLEEAFQAEGITQAVKTVYARTPSSMGTPPVKDPITGQWRMRSVYRPDWKAEVIGMAEANKWRALRNVGKLTGRWPATIREDEPAYDSHEPSGTADGYALGILALVDGVPDRRRGKFKLKTTRTRRTVTT